MSAARQAFFAPAMPRAFSWRTSTTPSGTVTATSEPSSTTTTTAPGVRDLIWSRVRATTSGRSSPAPGADRARVGRARVELPLGRVRERRLTGEVTRAPPAGGAGSRVREIASGPDERASRIAGVQRLGLEPAAAEEPADSARVGAG